MHLYLWDDKDGVLRATLESDHDLVWSPGHGVVGKVWETKTGILAVGDQCHDGTFGLTPQEQQRHSRLTEVAAEPVFDDDNVTVIAVLSASNDSDQPRLTTESGAIELRVIAFAMARLLLDVLKWRVATAEE